MDPRFAPPARPESPQPRRGRASQALRNASRRSLLFEKLDPRVVFDATLFMGADLRSPTNAGLIQSLDLSGANGIAPTAVAAPLAQTAAPFSGQGISGLAAFTADTLFATTGVAGAASQLLELDAVDGAVLRAAPLSISVGDLAANRDTGELFAIRSGDDGQGLAGELYRIDPTTGVAVRIGDTGAPGGGLAWAGGALYLASVTDIGAAVLHTLDPATAAVLTTVHLSNPGGAFGPLQGLTAHAGRLIGSEQFSSRLVSIDPQTGVRALAPFSGSLRAYWGDVEALPESDAVSLQRTVVYEEHFESGAGGFEVDNSGGTQPGMWHVTLGRSDDRRLNHTPDFSFYYGAFETSTGGGNYVTIFDHEGRITSPLIQLPSTGASSLSFSYLLSTRLSDGLDEVDVFVVQNGQETRILSRIEGRTLVQTHGQWLTAIADLTPFAGQQIQLRFQFDTADEVIIDPEGWYVDDLLIVNTVAERAVSPGIAGYKWHDQDFDGVWDPAEPGLNGWTLYLDANDNGIFDAGETQVVTANDGTHDGAYAFVDLAPGDYIVRELLQPGWKQSSPGMPANFEHRVAVAEGAFVQGEFGVAGAANFGNFQPDVAGYKWNDADGDGVWDPGEPGLNGWTIYVDSNNNGQLDSGEPQAVTKNDGMHDGAYWFADLPPGAHTLRESLQPGWKQSSPGMSADFEHQIDVVDGAFVNGAFGVAGAANFGNFQPDVAGYKWNDADGDGVWDPGEPGLNGWTIYVDSNNNGQLDSGEPQAVTKNDGMRDGAYWFADLPPGAHSLREVIPAGWQQVFPGGPTQAHSVTVADGSPVFALFGEAAAPNFGNRRQPAAPTVTPVLQFTTPLDVLRPGEGFVESPFIRPADDPRADWDPSLWKFIEVHNPGAESFQVTAINKIVSGGGAAFLDITDANLNPPAFPLTVPAGETLRLFVFYEPEQPDWYDNPATPVDELLAPPHRFVSGDRLQVVTDAEGASFDIQLVGAATYDSDITYDGIVNNRDLARLEDLLTRFGRTIVKSNPGFDPTSDINVRFANGASQFPEIGLGDWGTLNVEWLKAVNPLLDLNGPDEVGVAFATQLAPTATATSIADTDAVFANGASIPQGLNLNSLVVTLENPQDGLLERLRVTLNPGTPQESVLEGQALTIDSLSSLDAYSAILSQVEYVNEAATRTAGARTIVWGSTGSAEFAPNTEGNQVRTTIAVAAAPVAAAAFEAEGAAESEPTSSAACLAAHSAPPASAPASILAASAPAASALPASALPASALPAATSPVFTPAAAPLPISAVDQAMASWQSPTAHYEDEDEGEFERAAVEDFIGGICLTLPATGSSV